MPVMPVMPGMWDSGAGPPPRPKPPAGPAREGPAGDRRSGRGGGMDHVLFVFLCVPNFRTDYYTGL
jgi:hypothetical protein